MMILQQTRGALSSGDQLALDLPFSVTKSLTARIGPTPTFTRASAASFIGSDGLIQTAATNAPRFDHDPLTLACKGLLIESSRTNLIFPSDTLTTQTVSVTATSTTLSFYGTGTVVLSGAASATVVGSGAYPARRTLTFTPTAGSLTLTVTGSAQYAQLEAGSFATSYIPTTTASVIRSADVCSIPAPDAASLISVTEGSWNINFLVPGTSSGAYGNSSCLMSVAADNSNRINAFQNSLGSISSEAISSSVSRFQFQNTSTVNAAHKLAFAYKIGETSSHFVDNALPTSTPSNVAFVMPTFTTLRIGSIQLGAGNYINGTISSFRYYKKRLPNAKLQALTV